MSRAPASSGSSKVEQPGWPELGGGLATFMALLVPCARFVGYFQGQPVLQGVIGSTAGGIAGIGGFAAAAALRLRSFQPFGFKPVSSRCLVAAAALALVGCGLAAIIQLPWEKKFYFGASLRIP